MTFMTGGDRWTMHHLIVFLITFFSYALFHASRKTLSTVKSSMIAQWTPYDHEDILPSSNRSSSLFPDNKSAQSFLGILDGGFLGAYAIGLFISGVLGDRFEPRLVLVVGMWTSSTMIFIFGTVTEWLHFYSKSFYAFTWIMTGLLQSTGWPTEVCIMGNWFGHNSRGFVFGLWSACASVGNIVGTLLSAHFLSYGYEYAFLVNASFLFAGGFVVLFGLVSAPRDIGLPDPSETKDEHNRVIEQTNDRPKPIGFIRAWLLPGVIAYSLAYACLKLVNYSFFFWLPLYLTNNFHWKESEADRLSTWYDWGGILSGVVAGVISDHFSSRTPTVIVMLVCSIGALYAYSKSPNDMLINGILMAITGFFIGGPANLISSAISADLGKSPEIRGSAAALSTVTGIVDGTGSVGAALGQLFLPLIQDWFGWQRVFAFFILMITCTCLCLLPLFYNDIKRSYQHSRWSRDGYSALNSDADDDITTSPPLADGDDDNVSSIHHQRS